MIATNTATNPETARVAAQAFIYGLVCGGKSQSECGKIIECYLTNDDGSALQKQVAEGFRLIGWEVALDWAANPPQSPTKLRAVWGAHDDDTGQA